MGVTQQKRRIKSVERRKTEKIQISLMNLIIERVSKIYYGIAASVMLLSAQKSYYYNTFVKYTSSGVMKQK
jgi:hypothetical protein